MQKSASPPTPESSDKTPLTWCSRRGRPIKQVAEDLGINDTTLGNWVRAERKRRGKRPMPATIGESVEGDCCTIR